MGLLAHLCREQGIALQSPDYPRAKNLPVHETGRLMINASS